MGVDELKTLDKELDVSDAADTAFDIRDGWPALDVSRHSLLSHLVNRGDDIGSWVFTEEQGPQGVKGFIA